MPWLQIIKKIFSQEDIVGTAYLAASYLEQIGFDKTKLVYVVGSSGITQELDDVGIKYLPIGVTLKNPTYRPDVNFNAIFPI